MSMQLRVVHTASFSYDGKAVASYNQARLTPVTTPDQIVVHSRVEVTPKPWVFEYRDYFGTAVTAFEVLDPHEEMTVSSTSTVQTTRSPAPEPVVSWADLEGREISDRFTEYLTLPERVAPPADFAQRARQVAAEHERPSDAARDLCSMVHEEVEVLTGGDGRRGTAAAAWQQRAGAGQDVVHLALAGLRTLGLPARYVSGYAHPDTHPVIGAHVSSAPHAWVEWWDDGWRAHDPCADLEPADTYVALAAGRDHDDVRPISGIFSGAGPGRLSVDVEITRLA